MHYLHFSNYQGAFLAIISDHPILDEEHQNILDIEVVESRNAGVDYFRRWEHERSVDKTSSRDKIETRIGSGDALRQN